MSTWIIVDVPNLAARSFYGMPSMKSGGEHVGVLYGVLRDLVFLSKELATSDFVFAFEGGGSKRKEMWGGYKLRRQQGTAFDPSKDPKIMAAQVRKLQHELLPGMGFRNVLAAPGYEADDVIASVVKTLSRKDQAYIVSTDKDLYQLLRSNAVCVYHIGKREVYTEDRFRSDYGIDPGEWATVKAMAGCSSDNIPGLAYVGEKTAVKYLTKRLPESSLHHQRIRNGEQRIRKFLALTRLPLEGCPSFTLHKDSVIRSDWARTLRSLGFASIKV